MNDLHTFLIYFFSISKTYTTKLILWWHRSGTDQYWILKGLLNTKNNHRPKSLYSHQKVSMHVSNTWFTNLSVNFHWNIVRCEYDSLRVHFRDLSIHRVVELFLNQRIPTSPFFSLVDFGKYAIHIDWLTFTSSYNPGGRHFTHFRKLKWKMVKMWLQ